MIETACLRMAFRSPELSDDTEGRLAALLADAGFTPPVPGHFQRDGRGWRIGLGEHACELDDLLGFHFIAALLARSGEEILATDLVGEVTGDGEDSIERARLRITARIRSALDRLGDAHAEVARHLRQHVRTRKRCGCHPSAAERVAWSLEQT